MSRDRGKVFHKCAATHCTRRCQTQHLMCWIHWCQVPRALQARIYATCAAGMGAEYDLAVEAAVTLIAVKEARKAGLLPDAELP